MKQFLANLMFGTLFAVAGAAIAVGAAADPVTGTADYDSLSAKQIDANTAEFTLKKGGKTIGTTRRTVSKDGKTLTATNKNAKGEDTLIFDKQ
jgi:hypothetical protein